MKIGLYTPSWPGNSTPNGITTAVSSLVRGLIELGHTPVILTNQIDGETEQIALELPVPRGWSLLERLCVKLGRDTASVSIAVTQLLAAAQKAIKLYGIEVLVIEETQGLAGYIQKQLPIPVVVVLHGPWFLTKPWQKSVDTELVNRGRIVREGVTLNLCAGIVAPSENVMCSTLNYYGIKDVPNIVIPNAVEAKTPISYDALATKAWQSILFVGRWDRIKGGDIVLSAFTQMVERGHDVYFTFVGPDRGVVRPSGKAQSITDALMALPNHVRDRIDYKGACSKTEIQRLRQQHAICIVASRFENFPLTVLESLSAGVATIATAVGGIPEIIRDGENGILVPSEDANAMADACARLVVDRKLCQRLGQAAGQDVVQFYSPTEVAQRLTTFIEKSVLG